jgi:hypothetical protein
MRKALESGKGVFLSNKEIRELYDSNSKLPWDAIDFFVRDDDHKFTLSRGVKLKKFTEEDIVSFNKVNDQLSKLELQLTDKIQFQLDYLNKQEKDETSWIHDYELDLEIQFYLKESDPRYNDDIDNIVFEATHMLPGKHSDKHDAKEWFKSPEPDFRCEYAEILENPMCTLFRDIFYYSEFPDAEVQNVDMIWVDIKVLPQIKIDLD